MAYAAHVGKGYGSRWVGVIFREVLRELEDVIAKSKRLFPRIFPGARFVDRSGGQWTFPGGEVLRFRQGSTPNDYWRFHGHEIPFIGFEELANQRTSDFYLAMHSCCRSSVPGMPRMIRSTSNPYGPGNGWIRARFIDVARAGQVIAEQYENPLTGEPLQLERMHIMGHWSENPHLMRHDPMYLANLLADPDEQRRRAWVRGDWDLQVGALLSGIWDRDVHVVPVFDVPPGWRVFRSYDYGWSKPFSIAWWAVSDGTTFDLPGGRTMHTLRGDLFRLAEWYGFTGKPNEGLRLTGEQVAEGVVAREIEWGLQGRVSAGPADWQIFDDEKGVSLARQMKRPVTINGKTYPGIRWVKASKGRGSRLRGRDRVLARHAASLPGAREHPGIYITERCKQYMRVMPYLPIDDANPDDVDTNSEDHIYDETRYAIDHAEARGPTGSGRVVGGTH